MEEVTLSFSASMSMTKPSLLVFIHLFYMSITTDSGDFVSVSSYFLLVIIFSILMTLVLDYVSIL